MPAGKDEHDPRPQGAGIHARRDRRAVRRGADAPVAGAYRGQNRGVPGDAASAGAAHDGAGKAGKRTRKTEENGKSIYQRAAGGRRRQPPPGRQGLRRTVRPLPQCHRTGDGAAGLRMFRTGLLLHDRPHLRIQGTGHRHRILRSGDRTERGVGAD